MTKYMMLLATVMMVFACNNNDKATGSEGGPCYGNGTCDGTLSCVSDVCVDLGEIGDADTNTTDTTTDNQTPDEITDIVTPDKDINYNTRTTIQWGTDGEDWANSAFIGFSNIIYVVGGTAGTFPENTNVGGNCGSVDAPEPCYDAFLTKLDTEGNNYWTKQWGSDSGDVAKSVVVDAAGNIYVAGYTWGSLDGNINAGGSCENFETNPNCMDIFLTKWSADQTTKEWTKQWGTTADDGIWGMTIDASDNIYITGDTNGSFDGNTNSSGADCEINQDCATDILLIKVDSTGNKIWTKQWGVAQSWAQGMAVTVDASGNIFVAGTTGDSLDGNECTLTTAGDMCSTDNFLTKWTADGTKAWTKQWGSNETDYSHSVITDASGNIFVVGSTDGDLDGNINAGPCEQGNDELEPCADNFLTKWNADSTKAWTKQWGTNRLDYALSVAINSSGDILVTGETDGSLDGVSLIPNPYWYDIFLTRLNKDGANLWTKQWGTVYSEGGRFISADTSDNLYIVGGTSGSLDGNTNMAGANCDPDSSYSCADAILSKWTVE